MLRDTLSRSHLPALDGLRAVAVLVVIAYHSGLPVPGDLGVSAFFVLSGFLITRLLLRELSATGDVSLNKFYARRTMRIFPAYFVFLFLSYMLDKRAGQEWSTGLLTSAVTYTVNYFNAFNNHPLTSIAHAWSLAVEEQFYLIWPAVFLALASKGRKALITGVASAAVAAMLWRSGLYLIGHVGTAYVYNAFDTRLDNLAVGCLLAVIADSRHFVTRAESLAARAWYPIITLTLILVSRVGLSQSYHYSLGFTVDAILMAVFITQMLQLYGSRLWSWLEWPAVRYLGTISYPMYLYHEWGASVGNKVGIPSVVATIALASGSYFLIEKPFLKLKSRFAAQTNGWSKSQRQSLASAGIRV